MGSKLAGKPVSQVILSTANSLEVKYRPNVKRLAQSLARNFAERQHLFPSSARGQYRTGTVLLFGTQSVLHALTAGKRRAYNLFTGGVDGCKSATSKIESLYASVCGGQRGVYNLPDEILRLLSNYQPHQGAVLEAGELSMKRVSHLTAPRADKSYSLAQVGRSSQALDVKRPLNRQPLWLALDHLSDAHNVGNILRTAYCLGVDGVVVPSKSASSAVAVHQSAVVAKASAGSLDQLCAEDRIFNAHTFRTFLHNSKAANWRILGAMALESQLTAESQSFPVTGKLDRSKFAQSTSNRPISDYKLDRPTILVLGNEHSGLRESTLNVCDSFVHLPMSENNVPTIDSLNVSTAAGILMHSLLLP